MVIFRLCWLIGAIVATTIAVAAPCQTPDALFDMAFRDAQMAVGSRAALALARSAARGATDDPAMAGLIRDRQDAERAVREAEAAEARVRGATSGGQAARDAAVAAVRTARSRLDAADGMLLARAPDHTGLTGIRPLSIGDTARLLAADEAILLIQPTDRATFVFMVTAQTHGWRRVSLTARALENEVVALRAHLDPGGTTRGGEDASLDLVGNRGGFDRARAFRLYQALIGPDDRALRRIRTLYVIGGGAIGGLPLALLVTRAPQGADRDTVALRRTDWLIRRHALVTLPSVRSLASLRNGAHARAHRPFAGFGAPDLRSGPLPALPGAGPELRALAALLGADPASVRLGTDATEAAVRAAPLDDVRVIAFATHGLTAGAEGGAPEPALVFTPPAVPSAADDGLLTASEAAALRLSADWVILSACNTAGPDGRGDGEGLSGLARGFFAAGARALLVSHWRVADDVARDLTIGTLGGYARHPQAGRARALQRAMVAMIDDRTHPERADPSYWAPFVIAGDGR